MATIQDDPDDVISFHQAKETAAVSQKAAHLAMTVILQRKGRVLDAMNAGMATIRKHMSPENTALLDELSQVNHERSRLYHLAHQSKISHDDYFTRKKELEQRVHELEDKISQHSAEFLSQTQPITLENVQQVIPENAVLVEFMRYHPFDPKGKDEQERWGIAALYCLYPEAAWRSGRG